MDKYIEECVEAFEFPNNYQDLKGTALAYAWIKFSKTEESLKKLYELAANEPYDVWRTAYKEATWLSVIEKYEDPSSTKEDMLDGYFFSLLPHKYSFQFVEDCWGRFFPRSIFSSDLSMEKKKSILHILHQAKRLDEFIPKKEESYSSAIKILELLDDKILLKEVLQECYINKIEFFNFIPKNLIASIPINDDFKKPGYSICFFRALFAEELESPLYNETLIKVFNSICTDELELEYFTNYLMSVYPDDASEWTKLFTWINENCDPKILTESFYNKFCNDYREDYKLIYKFIKILPLHFTNHIFSKLIFVKLNLIIDLKRWESIPLLNERDSERIFNLEFKHQGLNEFLLHFFDYLEKETWQLLLHIKRFYHVDRGRETAVEKYLKFFNPEISKFLNASAERYPNCLKFYNQSSRLVTLLSNESVNHFLSNENEHVIQLFLDLPEDLKELFLYPLKNQRPDWFKLIGYYTFLIQVADILAPEALQNCIFEFMTYVNNPEAYKKVMFEAVLHVREYLYKNKQLTRCNYVRKHGLSFSNLYENPLFSDITFNIGKENLKLHKVVLRTIPALSVFLNAEPTVKIVQNESLVKLFVELAYDWFSFKNLEESPVSSLDLELHRNFSNIFNNPQDSDFTLESKKGEKLYLHKAFLFSSNLDYFKGLIESNLKEGKESKLVVDDDEFDTLKVILEYIYINAKPEFKDDESKQNFEQALDYYKAGTT